jgi:acyl carrier protein
MSEPSKEETILAQLRKLLEASAITEIDWNTVTKDSSIESLGLDSLSILDLLYDIEQEIGIRIEADEVVEIGTLQDIVDLLIRKGA